MTYDAGYGPLLETRLRVVTWNLWGRYGPWEERLPAIAERLRQIDADLIALQEVWHDEDRSQAAELAEALGGYHHVYAPAFEANGAWSGNAVLTRWAVRREEVRILPLEGGGAIDDEGEVRLALFVEIDAPRGPVQLFCTHLSWRADHSGVRQAQVRTLCEFLRDARPRTFPAILCGDLNAGAESDELRLLTGEGAVPIPGVVLRDAWVAAGDGPGHTVSNTNPFNAANLDVERRIDYILTTVPRLHGAGHCTRAWIVGDEPVEGVFGSDHSGVAVDLRY